jgi:hypothetical protein
MLPTDFKEANFTYTKPATMTDEQCSDLRVFKGMAPLDDKGTMAPIIISRWQLSKEDLEEIQKTGCVWLSITGVGMPPVSVFVEHPFVPLPV